MSVDDLQIYWCKLVYCHQAMVNLSLISLIRS